MAIAFARLYNTRARNENASIFSSAPSFADRSRDLHGACSGHVHGACPNHMLELTLASPEMLLIAGGASLIAGFIRGFSGFGGPAILVLILLQFYSPVSVLTKVMIIDLCVNVHLLPSTVRATSK